MFENVHEQLNLMKLYVENMASRLSEKGYPGASGLTQIATVLLCAGKSQGTYKKGTILDTIKYGERMICKTPLVISIQGYEQGYGVVANIADVHYLPNGYCIERERFANGGREKLIGFTIWGNSCYYMRRIDGDWYACRVSNNTEHEERMYRILGGWSCIGFGADGSLYQQQYMDGKQYKFIGYTSSGIVRFEKMVNWPTKHAFVGKDGYIYVIDNAPYTERKIFQKYSPKTGNLILEYSYEQLGNIKAIAIDSAGQVYILSNERCGVTCIDTQGASIWEVFDDGICGDLVITQNRLFILPSLDSVGRKNIIEIDKDTGEIISKINIEKRLPGILGGRNLYVNSKYLIARGSVYVWTKPIVHFD